MDGIVLARALKARVASADRTNRLFDGGRFAVEVATPADDPEIRGLLRECVFPGSVRLSFEREPDSLAATAIEGDEHQLLVARDRTTGRLAAVASRSSRLRFVNGVPARVGYLGQLRIAAPFGRRRDLLAQGFALCRQLHERVPAALYLASVVAANAGARRLLEGRLPGWPVFQPVDELATLVIPARAAARPRAITVIGGDQVGEAALADVLARNNRRYQFAPCWTAADLASGTCVPGLRAENFLAAIRGGSTVGCAAVWDQRAFKQVVVRGYAPALARCRPLINLAARAVGAPVLPRVGTTLAMAHLSHLAADGDDPEVFSALAGAGCEAARTAGLDSVALGGSAEGPMVRSLRKTFGHRRYDSVLYAAFWPDGEHVARDLDGRPSHPEMATL